MTGEAIVVETVAKAVGLVVLLVVARYVRQIERRVLDGIPWWLVPAVVIVGFGVLLLS